MTGNESQYFHCSNTCIEERSKKKIILCEASHSEGYLGLSNTQIPFTCFF